jgi:hypothetical protein
MNSTRLDGIKHLSRDIGLAGFTLRVDSKVNSIVADAIEHLSGHRADRPNAGRQGVPRAIEQHFNDSADSAGGFAGPMKRERALHGANNAIRRLVTLLVPGGYLNALPQAQELRALPAPVIVEMVLHFSSFRLSDYLSGEIGPFLQRIVFHRIPQKN